MEISPPPVEWPSPLHAGPTMSSHDNAETRNPGGFSGGSSEGSSGGGGGRRDAFARGGRRVDRHLDAAARREHRLVGLDHRLDQATRYIEVFVVGIGIYGAGDDLGRFPTRRVFVDRDAQHRGVSALHRPGSIMNAHSRSRRCTSSSSCSKSRPIVWAARGCCTSTLGRPTWVSRLMLAEASFASAASSSLSYARKST